MCGVQNWTWMPICLIYIHLCASVICQASKGDVDWEPEDSLLFLYRAKKISKLLCFRAAWADANDFPPQPSEDVETQEMSPQQLYKVVVPYLSCMLTCCAASITSTDWCVTNVLFLRHSPEWSYGNAASFVANKTTRVRAWIPVIVFFYVF